MNYTVRMYWKAGFEVIDENEEEYWNIIQMDFSPSLADHSLFQFV